MNSLNAKIRTPFNNRPILITGGNRTGTTWVGRMISASSSIGYIREAFNTEVGLLKEYRVLGYEYQFLQTENDYKRIYEALLEILSFKYSLSRLLRIDDALGPPFMEGIKPRTIHYFTMLKYRLEKRRPLLKDPIALFAAEWLAHHFNMQVIVLIRHPASYVASIKRLGWRFNFTNFTHQKPLLNGYLKIFKDELYHPPKDIISEAALIWKCFYHVVNLYRLKYPEWMYYRHEDLSTDANFWFKKIYNNLGIAYGPTENKTIEQHTSENNPSHPPNNSVHFLKRNSNALIGRWKQTLSKEEIFRIRDIVGETASIFYSDQEWE